MARCLRTAGGRPKAWIGAAIGLGTQIIGGLINKNAQEEQARAAQRAQEQQDAMNLALNKAQQMKLSQNAQKAYEEQFRVPYAKGGRKRLRSAIGITDGGVATPVGDSTFLLRGSTHNQVNESGKTGIGINVGGKEIEAENGELVDVNNGNLRVFSNSLPIPVMTRGGIMYMTPSKAVLAGYNKNRIFNEQQRMNGDSHGNKADEGTIIEPDWARLSRQEAAIRGTEEPDIIAGVNANLSDIVSAYNRLHGVSANPYGGNVNAIFGSDKLGASWGTADYIGLGTNILGSILSQTINRKGLSGLSKYAPSRPIPYVAGKLITTDYSAPAKLSNVERSLGREYKNIDRDTASSVAAYQRRNTANTNAALLKNDIYAEKYNTERDLLNKDTLNQQEVANKSIAAYNDWRDRYNNYMATIAGGKAESNVAMIQGIGSSIGNFLQQGIDRRQLEKNRSAYLATADKGNEMILNRYGLLTQKEQNRMYEDAINRGDWEAAKYWSNYASNRTKKRYSLKTV